MLLAAQVRRLSVVCTGSGYPIATGDSSSNQLGVEQSANMIIMAYAHARISGDGTLLVEYVRRSAFATR